MTSAPKRIFNSRMPNAKAFGNEPVGSAEGSSGNLQEKLQCGQAIGISRISSGDTVSRDLHLWHSKVIARISSSPTTILRSKVTLPAVYHAKARRPAIPLGMPVSLSAVGLRPRHYPFPRHSPRAARRDLCRSGPGAKFLNRDEPSAIRMVLPVADRLAAPQLARTSQRRAQPCDFRFPKMRMPAFRVVLC
jgi:hypothetical protein